MKLKLKKGKVICSILLICLEVGLEWGTPKPSLFYPVDLDRVIPAQVVQRKKASMISIKSEMLSVESLVYLRALAFEIVVEEEDFSMFSSVFDPKQ